MKTLLSASLVFGLLLSISQAADAAKAGHTHGASDVPDFTAFAIDEKTAPRPPKVDPADTRLPLVLQRGDRVVLIGNTLFDRGAEFPHFEVLAVHGDKAWVRNVANGADSLTPLSRCRRLDLPAMMAAE